MLLFFDDVIIFPTRPLKFRKMTVFYKKYK